VQRNVAYMLASAESSILLNPHVYDKLRLNGVANALSVHISSHVTPSFLSVTLLISMANNAPPPSGNTNTDTNDTNTLSLLDIVASSKAAAALREIIDNSPGHSYIKPDLSDVDLLKVFILDGNDNSVISSIEAATNDYAAVYKRAMYGETGGR
jgi:hypothetical protein